jgi:hypothetical protein
MVRAGKGKGLGPPGAKHLLIRDQEDSRVMRFFDCNMRLGRAGIIRPEHILDVPGLLDEMDYLGVDRALVYHAWGPEWDAGGGNAKLLEELGDCGRMVPCFTPLPHATRELADPVAFAADVRGRHGAVRLYPKLHNYPLSEWCVGPMLAALADQQVPALIELAQVEWNELAWMVRAYPTLPVILLATSYRINRCLYPLFEQHDNLYLETATYQIMRGIEDVCERFGPERLVFGTGLPLLDGGAPIAQVTYAELPEDTKRLIAGGTLARLLGVEGW